MSRIGNQPISIPENIKVTFEKNKVIVQSKDKQLTQSLPQGIKAEIKDNQVYVSPLKSSRQTKALHGLTRSLIQNMIIGLQKGYQKVLELHGTGYRVTPKGNDLELSLGFSHPVNISAPEGITFQIEGNNIIKVIGADKQLVGQIAANIRSTRPPDAYKGKGVRYQGEHIRLKPGKAAKAAGAGEE